MSEIRPKRKLKTSGSSESCQENALKDLQDEELKQTYADLHIKFKSKSMSFEVGFKQKKKTHCVTQHQVLLAQPFATAYNVSHFLSQLIISTDLQCHVHF